MVNAQNGEVQTRQPDIWNLPLHRNDTGSDHEREFESRETLVEHRTESGPSYRSLEF